MTELQELALYIRRKLDEVSYQSTATQRETTIFRVPTHIREREKNFYEPRMVSIGPYHWKREDLKCMELKKLWYLQKMLDEKPSKTLNDYLEALIKLEPEARRCYHEKTSMSSNEFVEMLLYDACFIIQVALNWFFPDEYDLLFGISWNIPLIKSDLLMLENQIPYFVLQCVYDIYAQQEDHACNLNSCQSNNESGGTELDKDSLSEANEIEIVCLSDILSDFLQHGSPLPSVPERDYRFDHLLDYYYYNFYIGKQKSFTKPKKKFHLFKILTKMFPCIKRSTRCRSLRKIATHCKPRMILCVTELQEAGISFKKAETIYFSDGVLGIPYTLIEQETRSLIMNLIAFEQCYGKEHKPLTRHAVFMDCIINTPRDVQLLRQKGIIENKLDNENAAAEFFNQLRHCCYLKKDDEDDLAIVFQDVRKYCKYRWPKYRAKLHRDYFNNPWSIISFVAAIVLLLLTFMQTLYTVVPYYYPLH